MNGRQRSGARFLPACGRLVRHAYIYCLRTSWAKQLAVIYGYSCCWRLENAAAAVDDNEPPNCG